MAESLVIEWNRDRLIAATGAPSGKSVNLKSAVFVDREEGLLPAELGQKLSAALSQNGISANEATVVFPRELVTFFRIELPNLSDDEIPAMLELQAATRLTVPVESVYLDFAPLPVKPGSETRDVLMVTAPQKHVNEARACLAACNIELTGVRVCSFGIAASVVHAGMLEKAAGTDSVEAIVSLRSDSIEMIFMSGQNVAFSHAGASWTSIEAVEQAVRAEISRARLAATQDMGQYTVKTLTLIGSPEITAAVPDSISARLNNAEVVRVDPDGTFLSCHLPAGLTAPDLLPIAGVIANRQTQSVDAVDLINPRKTPEKKDYSRLRNIAILGACTLLLVAGWKWRSGKVAQLEKDTAALTREADDWFDAYEMAKKNDLLLAERLKVWSDRDISWLDELTKIQGIMENTERLYIKQFKFSVRSGDYVGAIDASGYAKSRFDVEELMRLLTEAGYEVTPTAITQSLRDPKYSTELVLEINIPERKQEKGT